MVPIYNIMFSSVIEFEQVEELHDFKILILTREFYFWSGPQL